MSRIPFVDELGDALESAARRAASRPSRQRGLAVATAAFTLVILLGAGWWAMAPRANTDLADPADLQDTSTTAPPSLVAATPLPTEWGRVRPQTSLSGRGRLTLSGVVWDGGRFVAVGTDGFGDGFAGVVLASPDGAEWTEIARIADTALHDVATGDSGLVAVGARGFQPIAARSSDGREWEVATMPLPSGQNDGRVGQADAVAAAADGFVAGGNMQAEGDDVAQWPVVWRSADGWAWTRVEDPVFASAVEATVSDIVVVDDTVTAVGLVSTEAGTSVPVAWVSSPDKAWVRAEMPLDPDVSGFAGATGVARGQAGWVSVGFAPGTTGRNAAVWASSDGLTWERVVGTTGVLDGTAANASTQMHGIFASRDGFVAVGSTFEGPTGRYVIWTSTNGGDWRRFDLADPDGGLPTTTAHAVAGNHDQVIVAGAAFDVNGALGQGAVWLGPPLPDVTVSLPIQPEAPTEQDPTEATLTVDPDRAVQATQIWVRGRLPADAPDDEVVAVWLHSASGGPRELCEATRQGRNFDCRVHLGDLPDPPEPGEYLLAVEEAAPTAAAGAVLEVLPEGSMVMALSAVYSSNWWPLLQSLHIRNKGADPVDLGGWSIQNGGGSGTPFVFPAGTIVAPGDSVTVAFGSTFGATCFENTDSFFNWCRVVGDGDTVNYTDADAFWKGGAVNLVDPAGVVNDTWEAPK